DVRFHDEALAVADAGDRCEDFVAERTVLSLEIEKRHFHGWVIWPTGQADTSSRAHRRVFMAARVSRSASRRLIVSRLSYSFLPLARLTATFTRPFWDYSRTGISVIPFSTVL